MGAGIGRQKVGKARNEITLVFPRTRIHFGNSNVTAIPGVWSRVLLSCVVPKVVGSLVGWIVVV